MPRPAFEIMHRFWAELLRERGLSPAVRWLFYEDKARMWHPPPHPYPDPARFALRPRPGAEAEPIARFAYEHLDPKLPLAIVAYAVHDGAVITGLQGDLFLADEDVYRQDWNIYFDAKNHVMDDTLMQVVSEDDTAWARRLEQQPHFLSELDYLVSVDALRRQFGYRD